MGFFGFIRGKECWPKAKAAALQAMQLDPTAAEAHIALSLHAMQADRNLELAIREAQEAVRLRPDLAIAFHGLSVVLNVARRSDEALAAIYKATELDPLAPLFQAHYAWILHCLGRDDQAWQEIRSTLDVHPNDYYTLRILLYCANTPQRQKIAIEAGHKLSAISKSKLVGQGMLGVIYALSGERDQAHEIAKQLEQRTENEPLLGYYLGIIYGALGEEEVAIDWLEKAEQSELGLLAILAVEPSFSPLRPNPRFQALLRKLGLVT